MNDAEHWRRAGTRIRFDPDEDSELALLRGAVVTVTQRPASRAPASDGVALACLERCRRLEEAARTDPNLNVEGVPRTLDEWRAQETEALASFRAHEEAAREYLREKGLTLEEARRLLFPEPWREPKSLRRAYGLRARRREREAVELRGENGTTRAPAAQDDAGDAPGGTDPPEAAPPTPPSHGAALRAHDFAEVLHVEDLARIHGVSVPTARRHLVAGEYGPRLRIGRRWAVLHEAHFEHLRRRSTLPPARVRTIPGRRA